MFVIPDSYQGHIRRGKQQFENKEWIFQIYVFKTKTGKIATWQLWQSILDNN